MKAVIQRVTRASVTVDGEVAGQIGAGFLILLGVARGDTEAEAALLAAKIARLRVLEDPQGKMNLSLRDTGGGALVISQFTLCADLKKGNRPAFTGAEEPARANQLYQYFCGCLRAEGVADLQTGVFGAQMHVELLNEGPVTIVMDTEIWRKAPC
ncbi:MAG: D-tyrosyl-tRNA(Tyr) deacylase [Oscillospiraceae bacterium]|jgi:D-tyrosyl-tRNA(Tyr) deacylase|nr:D-tyrosyl-tRNA(Tyr) deacylase [Oscillospiraceae bacterium]